MMSMAAPAMTSPERVAGDDRPRVSRRIRLLDVTLTSGMLMAIALASIDFRDFGIGDTVDTDPRILVLQRLCVYGPVALGLLAGVPVLGLLLRRPMVLWCSFVGWGVFAAAFTSDPANEVERTVWFAAFVVLVTMVVVRLGWSGFLLVLSSFGIVLIAGSLAAHVFGWIPFVSENAFDGGLFGFERVKGLTFGANALGRAGAAVALMGLALGQLDARRWVRTVALAAVAIGLVGAIASQSRFSLLSLLIAGSIVLARRWRWMRMAIGVGFLSGLVGLALLIGAGGGASATRSGDASEFTTLFGRTEVWNEAAHLALDNPGTGVGIEALSTHYAAWFDAGYPGWDATNAHNVILQAAASHGLVGAALLLVTFAVGLGFAWRSGHIGAAELLVLLAIQGVAESILIGNPTLSTTVMAAAFCIAADPLTPSSSG